MPVTTMPKRAAWPATALPNVPSPTMVTDLPASTLPQISFHTPARWLVTMRGMRLASISSAMMPNSPDLAACVPRLFIRMTPGGSQSKGASRSSPALVMKTSFSFGVGLPNRCRIVAVSVTIASAVGRAAVKSSRVTPMVTECASAGRPVRATAASHMARSKVKSVSPAGF